MFKVFPNLLFILLHIPNTLMGSGNDNSTCHRRLFKEDYLKRFNLTYTPFTPK